MTPKTLIPALASFSRDPAFYHDHASVQRVVAKRLVDLFLNEGSAAQFLPSGGSALELGCGTGILTAMMLQALPGIEVHALDASAAMLAEARRTLPDGARVRWVHNDLLEFRPEREYDLVASSSAFHWVAHLPDAFRVVRSSLRPNSYAVIALMLEGTLGELHRIRAEIAPAKRPRSRLPSIDEVRSAVEIAGLQLVSLHDEQHQTVSQSARKLIDELHRMGLTGGEVSRGERLLTRGELSALIERYERARRSSSGVVATYRAAYLLLRRS